MSAASLRRVWPLMVALLATFAVLQTAPASAQTVVPGSQSSPDDPSTPSAAEPTVRVLGVTVEEPDDGDEVSAVFRIRLSAVSDEDVEVDFVTVDGFAEAGEDYTAAAGTVTIPAGERVVEVPVTVNGDDVIESNERLQLRLIAAEGATIAAGGDIARATIVDATTTADGVRDAILGFLVAGLIALLLVPAAEVLARRIGAIDVPNERSLHREPTPKLGGLAILAGVLAAGVWFLPWDIETRAILCGALVIAAVGMLDDVFDLHPALKLAGQIGAVVIPVASGVTVDSFTLPFVGGVDLGSIELIGSVDLGEVVTVVGVAFIVNVINLTDGVDGLAAGVCVISATSLAIIALSLDRYAAGILAAITAGAALGFLRHGFPPASSFMGDTGSNLLGYLLGMVAVQGALKTNAVVALFLPMIVLAVPILDTGFVIAKRLKYRRPIYRADRWHFHHRMANLGFSQRRTLAYLYGWALIMAGLALALRFVPYSDDRGNFDLLWTIVIVVAIAAAVAASVYLVVTLEILKLRRARFRALAQARGGAEPSPAEVDAGVARELETGSFEALDPETGEFKALDTETGEFAALDIEPEPAGDSGDLDTDVTRPAGT